MLVAVVFGAPSAGAAPTVDNLTKSADPVTGYADLHAHQFANLGFGGLLLWGEPFHENGMDWALPWSDFMPAAHGEVVKPDGSPADRFGCGELLSIGYPKCPPQCPPDTGPGTDTECKGVAIHGAGGLGDLLNLALSGSVGHAVGGYPEFDGWPRWNNYTGQQMYVDWVERSWRGGQRLMVMLAVNNETLCRLINRRASFGCADMPAVERQIQATKDLERYVDRRDDGQLNDSGWYRIAYSSKDARNLIKAGKLAVVIGTEVPSLFDCKKNNAACTDEHIRSELDRYHGMGVRHMFPIHNADNAFGGTALYNDLFAFNNKIITGDWWNIENCADSAIDFHVSNQEGPLMEALKNFTGPAPPTPAGSSCNARGLTTQGQTFMNALMDKKMVIDLDHMSTRMLSSALDMAEERKYPALAMSHSGFRGAAKPGGEANHEGNKDAQQLARIRNLGGTVATILHQGGRDDVEHHRSDVDFDCGGSSQAFAQMYLEAVENMQGRAVALGSDFNGFAGMPAPRFGNEACHGDKPGDNEGGYHPRAGVQYPFTAPSGVQLERQQVGNQVFDYNQDGVANAGLVPDFIEDLKRVGVSNADLAPLMNSAEQYVRMWELAEDTTPPAISCDSADGQWHGANVTLACTASDAVAGLASPGDASFTLSTSVPDGSETDAAQTDSREVCDSRGNCATAGPIGGNKVDLKKPTISLTSPQAKTYTTGETLTAAYTCTDGGSGVAECDGPVADGGTIDTDEVGARTFKVTAEDGVGNASDASVDYIVAYGICPLYDSSKASKAGSVVPLKLQLCNNRGTNLSSSLVNVGAIDVKLASLEALGAVEDAGNSNPDSNFRYDTGLGSAGGGYIFNKKTTGLSGGTWALRFRATGDPTLHKLEFQLR